MPKCALPSEKFSKYCHYCAKRILAQWKAGQAALEERLVFRDPKQEITASLRDLYQRYQHYSIFVFDTEFSSGTGAGMVPLLGEIALYRMDGKKVVDEVVAWGVADDDELAKFWYGSGSSDQWRAGHSVFKKFRKYLRHARRSLHDICNAIESSGYDERNDALINWHAGTDFSIFNRIWNGPIYFKESFMDQSQIEKDVLFNPADLQRTVFMKHNVATICANLLKSLPNHQQSTYHIAFCPITKVYKYHRAGNDSTILCVSKRVEFTDDTAMEEAAAFINLVTGSASEKL